MTSNAWKTLGLACLVGLLYCRAAHADLGTCLVFRGGDSDLEGDFFDKTTKSICDAYSVSSWSDRDFVFVLDIAEKSRPEGSYAILPIELVMGDRSVSKNPWTLQGYKITAPDVDGIRNGVAEIVSALRAGSIYRLQPGRRSGAVANPQTRAMSPK